MRRLVIPLALLAVAAAISGAAIVDHSWKQRRIQRIEVREWYCRNFGTYCGGVSSASVERRWNQRQLAYEVVVAGLAGAAVAMAVSRVVRN